MLVGVGVVVVVVLLGCRFCEGLRACLKCQHRASFRRRHRCRQFVHTTCESTSLATLARWQQMKARWTRSRRAWHHRALAARLRRKGNFSSQNLQVNTPCTKGLRETKEAGKGLRKTKEDGVLIDSIWFIGQQEKHGAGYDADTALCLRDAISISRLRLRARTYVTHEIAIATLLAIVMLA